MEVGGYKVLGAGYKVLGAGYKLLGWRQIERAYGIYDLDEDDDSIFQWSRELR